MKKLVLFFLVFCVSHLLKSQIIESKWYEGEVYLNNKELRKGMIMVDFNKNLLHLKNENTSFIFLPPAVNHVKLYSDESKLQRFFSPFKYKRNKNKEDWTYFELLYIGKTTSILALGKGTSPGYVNNQRIDTKEVKFTFHIKDHSGNIKRFKASNAHIVYLLQDEKDKISDYIKANSLRCEKFDDLVKVFEYYDQLKANEVGI